MIGTDPASNAGGIRTSYLTGDLWPQQVTSWQYYSGEWQSDPQLTVTGNININIL